MDYREERSGTMCVGMDKTWMRLEQWIEGRDVARNVNEEGDDAREK